jgi:hypothetical protein
MPCPVCNSTVVASWVKRLQQTARHYPTIHETPESGLKPDTAQIQVRCTPAESVCWILTERFKSTNETFLLELLVLRVTVFIVLQNSGSAAQSTTYNWLPTDTVTSPRSISTHLYLIPHHTVIYTFCFISLSFPPLHSSRIQTLRELSYRLNFTLYPEQKHDRQYGYYGILLLENENIYYTVQ